MSDTPRTDAAVEVVRTAHVFKDNYCEKVGQAEEMVPATLARTLERELAEAQDKLLAADRVEAQRDQFAREAAESRSYAERLTAKAKALADALEPQEPLFAAYGMRAVDAYNELRATLAENQWTAARKDEHAHEGASPAPESRSVTDGEYQPVAGVEPGPSTNQQFSQVRARCPDGATCDGPKTCAQVGDCLAPVQGRVFITDNDRSGYCANCGQHRCEHQGQMCPEIGSAQ